jgi:hypothetical protein
MAAPPQMVDKRDWLIEEAFAYYCGADVDTPPATLIGQRAVDMIVDAAKSSKRKFQISVGLSAVSATLVGTIFLDLYGGFFNGLATISVVGTFATIGNFYSKPQEPSHRDLLGLDGSAEQARSVAALKEFRRLLADGVIAAQPSSLTSAEDHVPPALFAADGGRLLIIGAGDRSAIKPWKKKPVGAIRVEWVPHHYISIGDSCAKDTPSKSTISEAHCVDVLEDVPQQEFSVWRDDLVSKAKGSTKERLKGILNAMYALAIDEERNRTANVINQILNRLDGEVDRYSREAIDKILHGTKSCSEYAYILQYLLARKNGNPVRVDIAKRGHPEVHFGESEVTP